jgi:hypothetical protein
MQWKGTCTYIIERRAIDSGGINDQTSSAGVNIGADRFDADSVGLCAENIHLWLINNMEMISFQILPSGDSDVSILKRGA